MGRGYIHVQAVPPDPGDAEALPDGELAVDDQPASDRVRLVPELLDRMATEDDETRALDGEGEAAAAAVQRAEGRYVGEGVLDDVVLVAVPDLLEQHHIVVASLEDPREGFESLSLMHGQRPLQAPHVDVQDPEFALGDA